MENELKPTSIEEIRSSIRRETTIPIPPFEPGQEPIVIKVKRPDITQLLLEGTIPNSLITNVETLFKPGKGKQITEADVSANLDKLDMGELASTIDVIVEATFVDKALYTEFKDDWTIDQKNLIVAYAMGGVATIKN